MNINHTIAKGTPGVPGVAEGVLVKERFEASELKREGKRVIFLKEDIGYFQPWVWDMADGIIATLGTDTTHFVLEAIENYNTPFIYAASPSLSFYVGMEVVIDGSSGVVFPSHIQKKKKETFISTENDSREISESFPPLPQFLKKISDVKSNLWEKNWSKEIDARSVELVDLNNDGNFEAVVTSQSGHVYGFNRDGSILFEIKLPHKSTQVKSVFWPDKGRFSLILSCDIGMFYGLNPVVQEVEWNWSLKAAKTICVANLPKENNPIVLLGGGYDTKQGSVSTVGSDGKVSHLFNVPPPPINRFGWVRAMDVCKAENNDLLIVTGGYDARVHLFQNNKLNWSQEFEHGNWIRSVKFVDFTGKNRQIISGFKDGSLICFNINSDICWRKKLSGMVNKIQVLPPTNLNDWQVIAYQYSGKVEIINSDGRLDTELPSDEKLWDGILETTSKFDGHLWLCGQNRFSHHYLNFDLNNIKSKNKRLLRIFLSYSSNDKDAVKRIYKNLKTDEFDIWFDEEKLLPGQEWKLEISNALSHSDIVLVFLSKCSINKRGFVQKEISEALDIASEQPEGAIFIIPVRIDECEVPKRLKRWQWVNLFENNGYEKLMDSIRSRQKEITV